MPSTRIARSGGGCGCSPSLINRASQKAYEQFDAEGRMLPSLLYDCVVDVMEELVRFTWLLRDHSPYMVDRHSQEKAASVLPDAL